MAELDKLSAAFDELSDQDKDALRAEHGITQDECECSICTWSGNQVDVLIIDDQFCCPECRSPVILHDRDDGE